MRALASGAQRQAIAELYLDLNSALAAPLMTAGVPAREAHDAVLVLAAVAANHAQGRMSSASEISKRLGISRMTVTRRLEILAKLGFLAFEGSRCCVADEMLSPDQLHDIELIIRRAHEALASP